MIVWTLVLISACMGAAVGHGLWVDVGLPPFMALHAALMLTAWGALLPMGTVLARYFKVMPRQNYPEVVDVLFWWKWHQRLQYTGIAASTLGLAFILSETNGTIDTLHGRFGLIVMAFGWLQVVSALLRGTRGGPTDSRADPQKPQTWRGDHYDMTPRRRLFEAWHKRVGWAVTLLAAVTLWLGIDLVGAPLWLMAIAAALQAAFVAAMTDGWARRRWVDTYKALWGPDPIHPGNRPAPPQVVRDRTRV